MEQGQKKLTDEQRQQIEAVLDLETADGQHEIQNLTAPPTDGSAVQGKLPIDLAEVRGEVERIDVSAFAKKVAAKAVRDHIRLKRRRAKNKVAARSRHANAQRSKKK